MVKGGARAREVGARESERRRMWEAPRSSTSGRGPVVEARERRAGVRARVRLESERVTRARRVMKAGVGGER